MIETMLFEKRISYMNFFCNFAVAMCAYNRTNKNNKEHGK